MFSKLGIVFKLEESSYSGCLNYGASGFISRLIIFVSVVDQSLSEIGHKDCTTSKTSVQLLWLVADCHGRP